MIREKYSAKDRTSAARILDLEAQLAQARGELARAKRDREEVCPVFVENISPELPPPATQEHPSKLMFYVCVVCFMFIVFLHLCIYYVFLHLCLLCLFASKYLSIYPSINPYYSRNVGGNRASKT